MIRWVLACEVTIPGPPVAKGRPRFARTGQGVRTYTAKPTLQYERLVAQCFAFCPALKGIQHPIAPKGTPVRVDVVAYFPRPQRLYRKSDPASAIPHAVKPDLDNVIKSLVDGVSQCGKVWADDGQVQCIRAESWHHEKDGKPRTRVAVFVPLNHSP